MVKKWPFWGRGGGTILHWNFFDCRLYMFLFICVFTFFFEMNPAWRRALHMPTWLRRDENYTTYYHTLFWTLVTGSLMMLLLITVMNTNCDTEMVKNYQRNSRGTLWQKYNLSVEFLISMLISYFGWFWALFFFLKVLKVKNVRGGWVGSAI